MLISQQKLTPRFKDLVSGFFNKNERIVHNYIPNKHLYWLGSGREALRQILLNIKSEKEKKLLNVGVPAYTCQVVLEAVRKADCEPVFYDSGIIAEIKDIEKIIHKIDVLILSYNFGFLREVDRIAELCRGNKVILIEDCAQALGATYQGRLAGSFGDYAFYSFGISKNLGFCGGLIGSNKEIKSWGLRRFPRIKLLKTILEIVVSPLFFNKTFYPLTRRFLQKELTRKQEALDYELPGFAKRVVLNQFKRYNQILETRKKNGELCCQELKGLVNFVEPTKETNSAWLYFTILSEKREDLISRLFGEGVELGEMKTFRCLDGGSPKALEAEKKVLTFALHRDFEEVKFIVDKIKKVCLSGVHQNGNH